jgi:uncharacterized phage protein (TIGR01671 family)
MVDNKGKREVDKSLPEMQTGYGRQEKSQMVGNCIYRRRSKMREILFRGKSSVNGKWYYGYYVNRFHDCIIHSGVQPDDYEIVKPKTVGQYTGLTDKNGKPIFEGDIVGAKHSEQKINVPCLVGFGEFEDVDSLDDYNYSGWFLKAYGKCLSILEPGKDGIELEVIGNIHDNPELLER